MWDSCQLPLVECQSGDEAVVVELDDVSPVSGRLRELGLVPGALIQVKQTGSPMVLAIGDSKLCLRAEDVAGITVEPMLPVAGYSLNVPAPGTESA